MRSTWTPNGPEPLTGLLADALALDLEQLPLGRQAAMRVPGAARPRNLLVGMCAGLPLRALANDVEISDQPAWMSRTDGIVPVQSRMAWTLDDGYWYGNSLWAVERTDPDDANSPILDGDRVTRDRWQLDPRTLTIYVDGVEAQAEEYLYFDWPFEGMLEVAKNTLDGARAIEETWVARAKSPAPVGVLKHTPTASIGAQLNDGEPEKILGQWDTKRQTRSTVWGYLPPELDLQLLSVAEQAAILEGARNSVRTDFANHSNFPVSVIDGAVTQQSLTYRNAQGDVSRVYFESFPFYLDPIAARLSMDDVLPAGQRAAFDMSKFDQPAPPATGVPVED